MRFCFLIYLFLVSTLNFHQNKLFPFFFCNNIYLHVFGSNPNLLIKQHRIYISGITNNSKGSKQIFFYKVGNPKPYHNGKKSYLLTSYLLQFIFLWLSQRHQKFSCIFTIPVSNFFSKGKKLRKFKFFFRKRNLYDHFLNPIIPFLLDGCHQTKTKASEKI